METCFPYSPICYLCIIYFCVIWRRHAIRETRHGENENNKQQKKYICRNGIKNKAVIVDCYRLLLLDCYPGRIKKSSVTIFPDINGNLESCSFSVGGWNSYFYRECLLNCIINVCANNNYLYHFKISW